jgi:hypothetical protein
LLQGPFRPYILEHTRAACVSYYYVSYYCITHYCCRLMAMICLAVRRRRASVRTAAVTQA